MSMMWPPQSVKMVSTPSFFRALATRWPPEMTLVSRLLRLSVSSAVVVLRVSAGLVAVSCIDASITISCEPGGPVILGRSCGVFRRSAAQASARCQVRGCSDRAGPAGVCAPHWFQDQDGRERRHDIEDGSRHEYGMPVSLGRDDTRQGYQQRCCALCGIHEPGVGRRVGGAEGVGHGRGEEAVDLTPRSEEHTSELQSHSDL